VIVLVANSYFIRRRREALTSVALEIGFNYEGGSWTNKEQSPHLETALFASGNGPEFRNVMTGSASGFRISLFDFKYTVGAGRESQNIKQTVAAFTRGDLSLPEFAMQPKGLMQKIGNALVHKDIPFDSNGEFSRRFRVRSPEVERTRELFTPELLVFLGTLDPKTKWRLEGNTGTLIVYRAGKRVKPRDFRKFLEETTTLATQFLSLGAARKTLR